MGANDITLGIKLTADGKGLVGEVKLSRGELDKLGQSTRNYSSEAAKLNQQNKSLAASFRGIAVAGAGLIGLNIGAGMVRDLVRAADVATNIQSRLKLVSDTQAVLNANMEATFGIAQRTRQAWDLTADTYGRLARSAADLDLSQRQLASITETINQAVLVSGGTTESSRAALVQLGQGLASGTLRGEELNSVMEQTPRLAQALADGLGVGIGELRAMGEAGEITGQQIVSALQKSAGAVAADFANMAPTVSGAWQQMSNEVVRYIGAADSASGSSRALAESIQYVAGHLDAFLAVAAVTASVGLGALVGKQAQVVAGAIAVAAAAREKAAATAADTAAVIANLNATQAAIVTARADATAKLAAAHASATSAQAQIAAARAAGAHSFAIATLAQGEQALAGAMRARSAAMAELAVLGQQQARVSSAITAATSAQTAAQVASSGAMVAARGVLATLGGPVGLVTTALLAGASAWAFFGNSAEDAAQKSADAVQKFMADAESRGLVVIDELRRRAADTKQVLESELKSSYITDVRGNTVYAGNAERIAQATRDFEAANSALAKLEEREGNLAKRMGKIGDDWSKLHLTAAQQKMQAIADLDREYAKQVGQNVGSMEAQLKLYQDYLSKRAVILAKVVKAPGVASEIKHAEDFIQRLKLQDAQLGLDEAQKKAVEAATISLTVKSSALRMEIMQAAGAFAARYAAQQSAIEAEKKNAAAIDALIKKYDEQEMAKSDAIQLTNEYALSLQAGNDQRDLEISLMGQSETARNIAIGQYQIEKELQAQILKIKMATTDEDTRAKQIAAASAAAGAAKENLAAYTQINDRMKEWNGLWGTVEKTGKDAFVHLFSDGKSTAEGIGKAIQASVIDLLYQLTARKWIINIGTSVAGSLGISGGSSGGGSPFDLASNAYSILGSGSGFGYQAGSFLAGNGAATAGTLAASTYGGGMAFGGSQAAMLASQTAAFGTEGAAMTMAAGGIEAGGIASSLAAIPGWGWALGAALLLAGSSGLFGAGGGPKNEYYGGVSGSAFTGHDIRDTSRDGQIDALISGGVASYSSLASRFGASPAALKLRIGGDSDPNGTAPDSMGYQMTIGGGSLRQDIRNWGRGEGINHVPEMISRALLVAVQATDMGPVANAIVAGLDPQTITTDLLNQTAAALSGAADLFGAPNSPLQTAIHAAQATSDGLAVKFTDVGIAGSVSAGSIRQAVAALDLTSAAGQQAARDMLALAGSVKTYETQLLGMIGFTRDSLASNLLDAIKNSPSAAAAGETFAQNIVSGIENAMLGDLASQVSDIVTSGIITPALNALLTGQSVSEALSRANMDAVIQQATATATAFGQIWSDPDFIAAMAKIRATVSGATATSLSGAPMGGSGYQQAEKDAADSVATAKANLIDAYKRELDAQQQLADRMRGYVASLRNYRQSLLLGELSPLGNRDKYDEARRQWEDISRRAALGDTAAIEQQQGAGQAFLEASRAYNASSEAYVRDFEAVRAGLAKTESVAESQARIAAAAAATARSQLDALGDINRSVLTIPDAIRALAQALAQQASLTEKDVDGTWKSTGGATANTSTGVISFKDGTTATITDSQSWVNQQLAANDPLAVYNTAIAKGVSANSLDTMMGWSAGTSNTWALENGLAAFAAGGIASSGLYLAGERGPEIIEGIGATRVYPAEQTSALMSRISNPAANDALIGDIKELRRQVAAADLDRAHLAGLLERLIDAVDSGTAQTSGDLRDMKKHLSHVMSRMAA